MAKQYQWRADTKYNSTTTLSYGVTPSDKSAWQTADAGTGGASQTWTWWYRDTNTRYAGQFVDAISSRVALSITESWTTSVDTHNNLTVSVRVTINSIVRDDLRGQDNNNYGRLINIYKSQGGQAVLSLQDNQVANAHTIYTGPLVIDEYSFTIEPGGNFERSTLYLHNQTIGYESYDDIWMGIQFRNILPQVTTPGAISDSGNWWSLNRTGGHLQIYNGSSWSDNLQNSDGGVGTGDPPSIKHPSNWINQRTIGLGA